MIIIKGSLIFFQVAHLVNHESIRECLLGQDHVARTSACLHLLQKFLPLLSAASVPPPFEGAPVFSFTKKTSVIRLLGTSFFSLTPLPSCPFMNRLLSSCFPQKGDPAFFPEAVSPSSSRLHFDLPFQRPASPSPALRSLWHLKSPAEGPLHMCACAHTQMPLYRFQLTRELLPAVGVFPSFLCLQTL